MLFEADGFPVIRDDGAGEVGPCWGVAPFSADAEPAEIGVAELGFSGGARVIEVMGWVCQSVQLIVDFTFLEAGA